MNDQQRDLRTGSASGFDRKDWLFLAAGIPFVAALTCLVFFGLGFTLSDILRNPISYNGDALFYGHITSLLKQGWVNTSDRSGYPFGSELYDFPSSDSGNFLLLKLIGMCCSSPYATNNLFYVLSFPLAFASAFWAFRSMALPAVWALAAAMLFALQPFHVMRFAHLFYSMSFTVPIFIYLAYRVGLGRDGPLPEKAGIWQRAGELTGAAIISSFGIYNAAFGFILIVAAAVYDSVRNWSWRRVLRAAPLLAAIGAGVMLNLLPNLIHWLSRGWSEGVANRHPAESEIYGFKFIQLILPVQNHLVPYLRALNEDYAKTAPLVNENATSSLGLIASLGLVLAAATVVQRLAGIRTHQSSALLSYFVLVLVFFGMTGGGGSIFAYTVSPMIRGWNRITPFVGFACLALFFWWLHALLRERLESRGRLRWLAAPVAVLLVAVGVADQVGRRCYACLVQTGNTLAADNQFVTGIANLLPPGSAVYQLPYMPFPEPALPPKSKIAAYDHFRLTSNDLGLRSNYGVMKSYPGDLFFRKLAAQPLERQIDAIRRLGFAGIWIDRNGYSDQGESVVADAKRILGHEPELVSQDGTTVFFGIPDAQPVDLRGRSYRDVVSISGLE